MVNHNSAFKSLNQHSPSSSAPGTSVKMHLSPEALACALSPTSHTTLAAWMPSACSCCSAWVNAAASTSASSTLAPALPRAWAQAYPIPVRADGARPGVPEAGRDAGRLRWREQGPAGRDSRSPVNWAYHGHPASPLAPPVMSATLLRSPAMAISLWQRGEACKNGTRSFRLNGSAGG